MRKRIWIPCAVLLLVLCALLLWRTPRPQQTAPIDTPDIISKAARSLPVRPSSLSAPGRSSTPASVDSTKGGPLGRHSITESNAAYQKLLDIWQAPIEFYGKVVDEAGKPVAQANIAFHWVETPDASGNRATNTLSDSDGLFSLHGATGPQLGVIVNKAGYYTSHEAGHPGFKYGSFAVGDFQPDPHNPVVFHLRKKGRGVELTTSQNGMRDSLAVRVPKDGTPVRIDLFQKQASAGGQFEVSQYKPPFRVATNWSFTLSIATGGLVENRDEFQFEAPERGYQPSVRFSFTKGDSNWSTHINKQFYIVLGAPPQYGWLSFESDLNQETAFVTYAIGPTGSRDLEPADVGP